MAEFKLLKSPIKIGNMELRNRMVMPPMVTNLAHDDGSVSSKTRAYYGARAKGGIGLIIVEAANVHPLGKGFANGLDIHSDRFIPGLRSLADEVHAHGAKIAVQLYHAGRQTTSQVSGYQPVAPSPITDPVTGELPRELTKEEIKGLAVDYGKAAARAKAAGFDAVEIHFAHGYLLCQFLSPHTNKRTDEYGGSLENRMRFPIEVIRSVREAVGPDFPIIARISADEKLPDGITLEDGKAIAKRFEEEGVNAIHVSAGLYETMSWIIQPYVVQRGCLVDLAEAVKRVVSVPVIAVGRINDPELAECILAEGKADLVAFGRGLLADEELPNKVTEGRAGEVRKCIACLQACVDELLANQQVGCTVNARTGRECEFPMTKAETPRKVLVVGGGPAGMEAARVATIRGHKVTLWEKASELGGQLPLVVAPPEKDEFGTFADFLVKELERLGVEVHLNKEATVDAIRRENPDVVVVATGARPQTIEVSGVDRDHVVNAWDVLAGNVQTGKKVAVIGGGLVGCEVADFLAEKGHEVTIIEMLPQIGTDIGPVVGPILFARLEKNNVKVITGAKLTGIGERDISYEKDGKTEALGEFDSVVIAVGAAPDGSLTNQLEGSGINYYVIGDAVEPRRITHAVLEATRVAHEI
ncbi:MAG: FAD-dependent oxidoreductase [Bacillota bacterium]|jgi:2,4-dienoyl-CoA reductase-like NADH-dependent reductase (Old Yellow Enzyme family)/thioredoxin reductase